jgi:amino acid permease
MVTCFHGSVISTSYYKDRKPRKMNIDKVIIITIIISVIAVVDTIAD